MKEGGVGEEGYYSFKFALKASLSLHMRSSGEDEQYETSKQQSTRKQKQQRRGRSITLIMKKQEPSEAKARGECDEEY